MESGTTTQRIAQAFVKRAEHQGMRGQARDRQALEFVLGAAQLATVLGQHEEEGSLLFLATLVATRGYSALATAAQS